MQAAFNKPLFHLSEITNNELFDVYYSLEQGNPVNSEVEQKIIKLVMGRDLLTIKDNEVLTSLEERFGLHKPNEEGTLNSTVYKLTKFLSSRPVAIELAKEEMEETHLIAHSVLTALHDLNGTDSPRKEDLETLQTLQTRVANLANQDKTKIQCEIFEQLDTALQLYFKSIIPAQPEPIDHPMLKEGQAWLKLLNEQPSAPPRGLSPEERKEFRANKQRCRQDLNKFLQQLQPIILDLKDEGEEAKLKGQLRHRLRELIEKSLEKNLVALEVDYAEVSQRCKLDNKITIGAEPSLDPYSKDYGPVSGKSLTIKQNPFLHQGRAGNMLCGYYAAYALMSRVDPERFELTNREPFSKYAKIQIKKILNRRLVSYIVNENFNHRKAEVLPHGLKNLSLGSLTIDEVTSLLASSTTLTKEESLPPILLYEADLFGHPLLKDSGLLKKSTYKGEMIIIAKLDDHWYFFKYNEISESRDQLTVCHSLGYNICEDISHYYAKPTEKESERNAPPSIVSDMLLHVRAAAQKLAKGDRNIETVLESW